MKTIYLFSFFFAVLHPYFLNAQTPADSIVWKINDKNPFTGNKNSFELIFSGIGDSLKIVNKNTTTDFIKYDYNSSLNIISFNTSTVSDELLLSKLKTITIEDNNGGSTTGLIKYDDQTLILDYGVQFCCTPDATHTTRHIRNSLAELDGHPGVHKYNSLLDK